MNYPIDDRNATENYRLLTSLVAPRPIALVSTISRDGAVNLSPFSFFNLFSADPPIVIFSPLRRLRNNTIKHTLHNVLEVPEVVISIVTRDIAARASLASADYPDGVNEFERAGFTPVRAIQVRPPLVQEAKAALECRVLEVKPLGTGGGAGNLVICEVLHIHLHDNLLSPSGDFDHHNLDLIARLGGNDYTGSSGRFTLPKPPTTDCIGINNLPQWLQELRGLEPEDLAILAGMETVPDYDPTYNDDRLAALLTYLKGPRRTEVLIDYARELLVANRVREAWQVLICENHRQHLGRQLLHLESGN